MVPWAVRVHGNFAEMRGTALWVMVAFCLALAIGRVPHASGVSQPDEVFKFRMTGMVVTSGVFIASVVVIVLT